jgi:hypothetical protein
MFSMTTALSSRMNGGTVSSPRFSARQRETSKMNMPGQGAVIRQSQSLLDRMFMIAAPFNPRQSFLSGKIDRRLFPSSYLEALQTYRKRRAYFRELEQAICEGVQDDTLATLVQDWYRLRDASPPALQRQLDRQFERAYRKAGGPGNFLATIRKIDIALLHELSRWKAGKFA